MHSLQQHPKTQDGDTGDERLLSVILVSYNTASLTKKAIRAVWDDIQQSDRLRGRSEIIIVDNNSSDTSVVEISALKDSLLQKSEKTPKENSAAQTQIMLLAEDENTGFAAANNHGIAESSGKYILLLNSDTEVQPGALSQLIYTFQQFDPDNPDAHLASHSGELDRLGLLAASLRNPDGSYQAQGGDLPTLLSVAAQFLFFDDMPLLGRLFPSTQHTGRRHAAHADNTLEQKGWVAATAVMTSRAVINTIGDLDEGIFMYAEDMEWCLRAQHHLWDVAIDHAAVVMHHGSASSTSATALKGEIEGLRYIWAKHKPHWQRQPLRAVLILGCMLRLLLFGTIRKDKMRYRAYRASLRQLLHNP